MRAAGSRRILTSQSIGSPPRRNRKRPSGVGEQYRLTAAGPGVTPDVMWQGPGLHPYNRGNPSDVALESAMNAERESIRGSYAKCGHD